MRRHTQKRKASERVNTKGCNHCSQSALVVPPGSVKRLLQILKEKESQSEVEWGSTLTTFINIDTHNLEDVGETLAQSEVLSPL